MRANFSTSGGSATGSFFSLDMSNSLPSGVTTATAEFSLDSTTDGINYQWVTSNSSSGTGVCFDVFVPTTSSAAMPRYDGECDDCSIYAVENEDSPSFVALTYYTWAGAAQLTAAAVTTVAATLLAF